MRHTLFLLTLTATVLSRGLVAQNTTRTPLPTRLSDADCWTLFVTMSEPAGQFPQENSVSNEPDFQSVIPALRRITARGGVYLGVGPEQNCTFIANLEPAMAFIFDIRRQNALAHLVYKALFEESPTRAAFVERLFSRPVATPTDTAATGTELFRSVLEATENDSAYAANLAEIYATRTVGHHFALSADDRAWMRRMYQVFRDGGPPRGRISRNTPPRSRHSMYPTWSSISGRPPTATSGSTGAWPSCPSIPPASSFGS
jgi:hypothetical protein